jgi:Flp pilus assembly protein TadB
VPAEERNPGVSRRSVARRMPGIRRFRTVDVMDDRQPSPHEMRARMGFAGSILIGLGVAAALNAATHSMGVSLGIGLAMTIVFMVVFTRRPRRRHPDAGDETDAGDESGSAEDEPQP